MTVEKSPEEIQELMDEAFSQGPDSEAQREVDKLIQEDPELLKLWEEYQLVRKGIGLLEDLEQPTEITLARIRKAAQKQVEEKGEEVEMGRWWHFFLSRPVKVAAMFLLFIGVGVYANYWLKEKAQEESVAPPPPLEEKVEKEQDRIKNGEPVPPKKKEIQKPRLKTKEIAPVAPETKRPAYQPGLLGTGQSKTATPPKGVAPPAVERMAPSQVKEDKFRLMEATTEKQKKIQKTPHKNGEGAADEEVGAAAYGEPLPAGKPLEKKESVEKKADTHKVKRLIQSAKQKMEAKNYREALEDLLEAQKIKDSAEIRALISKCRQEMKPAE